MKKKLKKLKKIVKGNRKPSSQIFEPEGMWLQKAYCYKGGPSKNTTDRHLFTIRDHPTNGISVNFVIEPRGHSDQLTVFDLYGFKTFFVKRDAGELAGYKPFVITEKKRLQLIKGLINRWEQRCHLNIGGDFDTAALILTRLKGKVPTFRSKRVEERVAKDGEKKRGGKPVAKKLLKPLPEKGKRFDVLEHFKAEKTIREAMATFGMSRSTVLTHLYRLNKDHGVGYELTGEKAKLTIPK